ncbi:LOW QUALITY PROTEIN: PiggyBac transposable element-derived protein 4 [Vespula maculifrons]|uniref:PiggyBac transposable element-derived protein 4 n=1 Tax=Vespula maculifrons TaxID=7453 RepID=A0ABD2CEZ3_VESMC
MCVIDYNFNIAVDKTDMDLKSISTKRYRKYFFHVLDMAVRNSYYLCQISTEKNWHLQIINK